MIVGQRACPGCNREKEEDSRAIECQAGNPLPQRHEADSVDDAPGDQQQAESDDEKSHSDEPDHDELAEPRCECRTEQAGREKRL